MSKPKKPELLQKLTIRDEVNGRIKPVWTLVAEAIRGGRADEALELIDYGIAEAKAVHDSMISDIEISLAYIASKLGEEEVPKFLRYRYESRIKEELAERKSVEALIQSFCDRFRTHYGSPVVTEEADRYVLTQHPCPSGGRLRQSRPVAVTKKAYPWSWGKAGVPYYCIHCCVAWEIIPIEVTGAPMAVRLINERPEDPCVALFYKKPELIPAEYFTRIGKKKKI